MGKFGEVHTLPDKYQSEMLRMADEHYTSARRMCLEEFRDHVKGSIVGCLTSLRKVVGILHICVDSWPDDELCQALKAKAEELQEEVSEIVRKAKRTGTVDEPRPGSFVAHWLGSS